MPGASRTFKYSVIMLILFAVRRTEDNFVSVHSQIRLIRARLFAERGLINFVSVHSQIRLIRALQIVVLFATPAFIQRTAINGLLARFLKSQSSIQRHGG